MAERNFEEKAAELREARDIYMEGEESSGLGEGVGIVPGAPGTRPVRGRRVEDEVKDQRDLLRGLRGEVQELRKVVSVLRGGLVETSEAFAGFHKEFIQVSKEFQEFHKGFSQVVKEFREFSQVSKGLREEFGKLLEWIGGLGKLSEKLMKEYKVGVGTLSGISYDLGKEYEKVRKAGTELERVKIQARVRARARKGEEGKGSYGYGVRGRGRGLGYGFQDILTKEEIEKQLSIREQLKGYVKRSVIGLIFGEVGGRGYGRYGRGGAGELVGDMRSVMLASLGPVGMFVGEWLGSLYGKWQERKELKKQLEEQKKAELAALGIRKVRQIEREKGGVFSELMDWAKEVLWGKRMGGGVVLSAVGGGGVGQGRAFGFGKSGIGVGGVGGLVGDRSVGKVSLSDVELVQERNAKIYADKLYIEAKQVSGAGGGGGILDMLPGGGLLGRFGRVGRWIGRRAGWIGLGLGAGLAFLGGIQEGGLGTGIARGGGALLGGLGGAKLGALIGTVIAPGIGTAIGSVLGGALGMFGGEKIADAVYSGMRRLIKEKDWVESLRSGFMSVVDRIGQFLQGVVEGVKGGIKVVGEGVSKLGGKVLDVAKWLGESLGIVAREAEAGTIDMVKAAGVVGRTKGDIGGMSVGMYQFTRETALKFLREYGYMKEFEGVEFGTPEWKRRWQEVASKYGEAFARAQQEFAVREYFVPGVRVAERFGLDVSRSRALQEMVIARAIQHGVGGFGRVLQNVFSGMTPEQVKALSPQEIITRVYDYLIANVDRYWASSSPQVREGVRKRLIREKELLLAMERQKVEVKKQEGLQKRITKGVEELEGSIKEQVKVNKSVGAELKEGVAVEEFEELAKKHEAGALEVESLRSNLAGMTEGGIVDDVLVADQREVARQVIEEGVRTSTELLGNIVRVIEGLRGGEGVGSVQKVVMSGGDAFSKVPLFPEDMGLVMMMLGLV